MIKYISKVYTEDEDGFDGNCDGYVINTNAENLLNFLSEYAVDAQRIVNAIKSIKDEILIIKNINVDERFQGFGYGSEIINYMLNESYCSTAILICDTSESQKEGFVLEKFYENNDFQTIFYTNDYPIMMFPIEVAEQIKKILDNNETNKILRF